MEKTNTPYTSAARIMNNNFMKEPRVFISPKLCYELLNVSHFCDDLVTCSGLFLMDNNTGNFWFFFKRFPVCLIVVIYWLYIDISKKKIQNGSQQFFRENETKIHQYFCRNHCIINCCTIMILFIMILQWHWEILWVGRASDGYHLHFRNTEMRAAISPSQTMNAPGW